MQVPGPGLESRDPINPCTGLSSVTFLLTGEGLKDVPRATQQILESEPGEILTPALLPNTVFTCSWVGRPESHAGPRLDVK